MSEAKFEMDGGDGFILMKNFKFGSIDPYSFSISTVGGRALAYFTSKGTVSRNFYDYGLNSKDTLDNVHNI